MIEGATISKGVRFMDLLNKDISRLMATVDDQMQSIEFQSLWGSPCYFKSSQLVTKPIAWVPHVFARVYVPEGKDVETYSTFAFFHIYLTPKHHEEPLAYWGVGQRRASKDIWPEWDGKLLRPEGPDFLRKKDVQAFETSREFSGVLEFLRYAVKPLVELNSEDQLERLIAEPIRKELGALRESGKEPPKPKSK